MKRIVLISIALLTCAAMAHAQEQPALQQKTVKLSAHVKGDASTKAALMLADQKKSSAEVKVVAKVSKNFDRKTLELQGVKIGSQVGNIVTLRLPSNRIQVLDACNEVLQYQLARPVAAPNLNKARVDTKADSVHEGLGLPQAINGEGVIIGITDWGFDYKHPNYNNNGESNRRLLRAWDQFKLSGPHPNGFDYGTVYENRHDLLAAQCDTNNLYSHHTHGTHVAGIAAGRGIDGEYIGMAPYANLIFCSFTLDEAGWLDAVAWMKQVAQEEQKRLVVNSSWGMYTFSTLDGTSLLSQAINSYTDSGIVFCTSAGNNGNDNFHVMHTFETSHRDTMRTAAKYYSGGIGEALILWGETGKPFEASLLVANGEEEYPMRWLKTTEGDAYLDSFIVAGSDTLYFNATIEEANPFNQRPHMLINIATSPCQVTLMVTAEEGTVHGWNLCNTDNNAGNMGSDFVTSGLENYTAGDAEYGIGEPACADGCISVAAHSSGSVDFMSHEWDPGDIASFSSHGPLINGVQKPEISAPGVSVVSSLNSYYDGAPYPEVFTYNYASRKYIWARLSGTSMSSPMVSGIVALMLQANPQLTPQRVKEIIIETALNDSKTGDLLATNTWSKHWGWGKIDALRAVNKALATVAVDEVDNRWLNHSLQLMPNPASDHVMVLTGRESAENVQIYSLDGRLVMEQMVTLQSSINIKYLPAGIYVVRCGGRTTKLVKH